MDFNELDSLYKSINSAIAHSKEYEEKIAQLKLNVRDEVRPIVVQEKLDEIKELEGINSDLDEMTKNDIEVFNNEVSQALNNNSQKLVDCQNKLTEERANYANQRKTLLDRHSRLFLDEHRSANDEMVISAFQKAVENIKSQHEKKMQDIMDSIKKIEDENNILIDYSEKMSQPLPVLKQNFDAQKNIENAEDVNKDSIKKDNDNMENNVKGTKVNASPADDKHYEIIVAPNQNKEQKNEIVAKPAVKQQIPISANNLGSKQQIPFSVNTPENKSKNNNGVVPNYIKIANGELDMFIGKSSVSVQLDEIDEILETKMKEANASAKEKYFSYFKNSNPEKLKEVKYLIGEIQKHGDKMLENKGLDQKNVDSNIYKAFQICFLDSVKNGIKNGMTLESIKNDINNIDKYFDKYVNCIKTNQRDDELPISYDVRYEGFLQRKDFSNLKKYAKNARAFADVKANPFTKFAWNVQDKIGLLVKKMKSQKLLSGNTAASISNEDKNVSSEDSKSENDIENDIEESLNAYVDTIINNDLDELKVSPDKINKSNNSKAPNKDNQENNHSHEDR